MANYYGVGRTNYFRVKDDAAFKAALDEVPGVRHETTEREGITFHAVMDDDPDGAGWNTVRLDEETGEEEVVDLLAVIAAHLIDNEVAVMMEAGHEKHRYVIGWAEAINNRGERRRVSLEDIYALARELGTGITRAHY